MSNSIGDQYLRANTGNIMNNESSLFKKVLKGTWGIINTIRKVVINLFVLVLVIALVAMAFTSDSPKIAKVTALEIKPNGRLVEQLTAQSFDQLVDEARGAQTPETLLKDVIDAIEAAKDDDRVQVLVINLSSFSGARLTKLQDAVSYTHLTLPTKA